MSVTALDILKAAREYAADPDHIVTEPSAVRQSAEGEYADPQEGVRGCLLGCAEIAYRKTTGTTDGDVLGVVFDMIEGELPRGKSYEDVMREGHAAILATYDRAIAKAEAKS